MISSVSLSDSSIKINDEGLYCLNDLHKASGGSKKNQPSDWLRTDSVKALEKEILNAGKVGIKKTAGRYGGTYVCRELVYAYAMWISAKFHLEVINVFDAGARAQSELNCLVDSVRRAGQSISSQLDSTTLTVTELNSHGRSWGVYGHSIRKAKKAATIQLEQLKDEIQLKLELLDSSPKGSKQ